MTPDVQITIFSAAAAAACAGLAAVAVWRTGELVSPLILFLAMTAFDVFLPAALYFPVGSPMRDAMGLGVEIDRTIGRAVLTAGGGGALFAVGYAMAGAVRVRVIARPPMASLLSARRAYF